MAIQWFPGHMHLTRKAIEERVKEIDVVIELLDARLPGSSANPMLAQLTAGKPALKVLNKQDLADPVRTQEWLAHFNALPGTRALGLDASMTAPAKALIDACFALAPKRGASMAKPMRVLICGIPNVGKSTLINTLKGKRSAKTGDEAGVTKIEQRIVLQDAFYLFDTPGVLWPRIIVAKSGYNLAASGAIGKNAFDEEEVALELLDTLRQHYPAQVETRYKLTGVAEQTDEQLLEAIGRKRGALQSGGRINLQKSAEVVIHDFRQSSLGRITLETPEEFAQWLAHGQKMDAERQVKKDAIELDRAIRFKKVPRPARGEPSGDKA
ncbi:MAG: ribosome biogenesis GTPase YlqF [Burkholderiales bacterium]|jgi:ribosome biogenesis GTPase A|uniref:ribosome biogenesis GTPase YlqF n=1 Tax=Candidatus Aalborgicola defluviihabitans TaxID=3386187 RepID=UPI001DE3962C|nr:ribosome biogenesis GTPase YlqF [Burkholderiales bacterium]MBK6568484.1 ribosome biogenesis GTPase YlqF [Burkholderiales bacterium]